MLLTLLIPAFCLGLGVPTAPVPALTPSHSVQAKIRIGTYDNRSIAIAFAASRHNPVKEKMAAYNKAKAAGEKDKMKELEAWGENYQRTLHFQGFGRVPVNDLLQPVKEKVRELAKQKGLAAVAMSCDFTSEDVELVDITEDLVKLFEPTDRTLKMALSARSAKLVDLVELSKLPANK